MKIPRFVAACLLTTLLLPAGLMAAEKTIRRIDPKALELLKRMSTTLASAKAFTYHSKSIIEAPAKTGQSITLFPTAEVAVQRPNKIAAHLAGEAPCFDFYYDGETVSAYAPGNKVYSQASGPKTIDAMLVSLERETGIRFPTMPLLLSNPYAALTRNLTSAVVIGQAKVNGVDCTHLALRAPGVNWEIWIENSARALPRRLVVTFTNEPNSPRTIVEFCRWNLNPWLRSSQFVFHKPAGATEIPFLSVLKSSGR